MAIYKLTAIKGKSGVVFACPKCKVPATSAYGAQNKDQLAYLLLCEKCFEELAAWPSPDVRDKELREFAAKLEHSSG